MREIELKVLGINKTAVEKKLRSVGAKKLGRKFIIAEAFDFKTNIILKRKDLLRIRTIGKQAVITYKKYTGESKKFKIMNEYETSIGEFDTVKKIFALLGLQRIVHHEKWRTSYRLQGAQIEIEEYPGVPPYLEIEGTKKSIKAALMSLGLSFATDTCNLIAEDVLKKYGANPNFVSFKKSHAKK